MKSSIESHRRWQERSRLKALERKNSAPRDKLAATPREHRRKPTKRRNDAPWRAEVIALRGEYCRSCGTSRNLQCDHVKPRSQGGKSVVENGTMLCVTCHDGKTNSTLKYKREWLDQDQIDWLAREGWVEWDKDGLPFGNGWKHFEEWNGWKK